MLKQTRGPESRAHFSTTKTRSNSLSSHWNAFKAIFQYPSSPLLPTPPQVPSNITGDPYSTRDTSLEASVVYRQDINHLEPTLSVVRFRVI